MRTLQYCHEVLGALVRTSLHPLELGVTEEFVCKSISTVQNQINKLNKVTKWYLLKDDGSTSYHHFEDGWSQNKYPMPIEPEYTNQLGWGNYNWVKQYAYLAPDKDGMMKMRNAHTNTDI